MRSSPETTQPQQQKGRTSGENAFDLVTYVGLGGFLNAAVSMQLSDWVHNAWTKLPEAEQEKSASKKAFNFVYKNAEYLAKPLEPLIGKNTVSTVKGVPHYGGAIKYTRRFMQGCAIGAGGWLVIPVIKKLEDNKIPLVNWYNRNFTAEKADDNQTRAKLGDDTKQTWIGLLTGRAVAFFGTLTLASWAIEAISKRNGRDLFETLTDFTRNNSLIQLRPERLFKNMTPTRGRELSYQLAGEAVFTAIAVGVMYMVSKAVSRMTGNGLENGNGHENAPAPMTEAPAQPPTAQSIIYKKTADTSRPKNTVHQPMLEESRVASEAASLSH